MYGIPSKKQVRLGDLIVAAYDQTARVTRPPQAASRIAIRKLTRWLEKSNRPNLLQQLPHHEAWPMHAFPRTVLAAALVAMALGHQVLAADRSPASKGPDYAAIVAAADRDPADRANDTSRKPAAMLAFLDVRPGQRVAELGAGDGYTSELLARAVGPDGTVYGQNNRYIIQEFSGKPWTERLKKPVMKNVVRLDREFDAPFPKDVRDLDLVAIVLMYHDTYWMKANRRKMNAAVFKALRRGGTYVVIDHSAAAGHGAKDVESLHRVDEALVRKEVLAAGFKVAAGSDFLRNPADQRDWTVFDKARRGTTDRFALKFVKP
jgi:predicted methyltransferase